MASALPYHTTPGTLGKLLDRIKKAAVPGKLTQDVLQKSMNLKGGSGTACIPLLKRIGFLSADGTPTELYVSFRNPSSARVAMARAMRIGYAPIFQANESALTISDDELRGLVVQVTGFDADARAVDFIMMTFKLLKGMADTAAPASEAPTLSAGTAAPEPAVNDLASDAPSHRKQHLGLSYTIYLNLPNTQDVAVFNAIFRALRDNLLR